MKTKQQKNEELEKGRGYLKSSQAVLLVDLSKVRTKDIRNLRQELKTAGNPMLVIKKRLLGILFKEAGAPADGSTGLTASELKDLKVPVGAIFASSLEAAASSAYRFFSGLEKDKKVEGMKLLGGYDMNAKAFIPKAQLVFIGQLPPREVLLAQLFSMIAAPIRSFLYVLSEKSKKTA